jgi:hypothetical protein
MILPAAADRPVVVFKLWPSLGYGKRLLAAFVLIAGGMIVQLVTGSFAWGVLPLVLGNLFLLVSGYDNRVDFGKYDPAAEWARVDSTKLDDLKKLDREIRRWDLSALDVTNPLGLALFIAATAGLVILAIVLPGLWRILVLDAALLLLPHWLTGTRSVLRLPKLLVKAGLIEHLFDRLGGDLERHRLTLLMLLRGEETRVPSDVKFRVEPLEKPDGFLGLYGQVVLNEVQGRSYPYFYVVLVARKGFGLADSFKSYHPPRGMTKELKPQDEVEVLVIRQTTTKKSGYHTAPAVAVSILHEGLHAMHRTLKRHGN